MAANISFGDVYYFFYIVSTGSRTFPQDTLPLSSLHICREGLNEPTSCPIYWMIRAKIIHLLKNVAFRGQYQIGMSWFSFQNIKWGDDLKETADVCVRLFSPLKNIQQFEVNLCLKNCRNFCLLSRKVLKLKRVLKSQQGKDRFVHCLRHISPIIIAIIIIIIISGDNEKIPVRDKLCRLR